MELIPYLSFARLLVPLLMFRFRFLGFLLSIGMDMIDWLFLKFTIPSKEFHFYQNWDKAMDLYMFSIATYISLSFKDKFVKKTVIFLFLFRALGDIIFFLTGFQKILLFTPNFLETFLLFYLAYTWVTKKEIMVKSWAQIALILGVIAITKVSQEYMLHVMLLNIWDLFNLGDFLGLQGVVKDYVNYIIMGGLVLHLPPLILWVYFITKKNK